MARHASEGMSESKNTSNESQINDQARQDKAQKAEKTNKPRHSSASAEGGKKRPRLLRRNRKKAGNLSTQGQGESAGAQQAESVLLGESGSRQQTKSPTADIAQKATGQPGEDGGRKPAVKKMDWSVLVAVFLVCTFTLGYLLFSGSLVAQNRNSNKLVRNATEYDRLVEQLSNEQLKQASKNIKEFNLQTRTGGYMDPFLNADVISNNHTPMTQDASKFADYTEILDKVSSDKVGYLTVPKADFSGPIFYGDVETSLSKGVGYLPNTAIPSDVKGTRSVLFGHTGLDNLHVFDDLDKLKKNDTFSIRVLKTTYHYKIFDIQVIEPSQVDAVRPQKDKVIVTLLTCTPKGINDHRLLVSGELVSVSADKPELQQRRSPSILAVTIIPLAACVMGAVYVWLRKQQINRTAQVYTPQGSN